MLHRFAIDGIADHLGEGGNTRIFGDEAVIPALLLRPDQHQFEPALPDDPAAQPRKHRPALSSISRISFRAARLAAVGIASLLPQPHQIEHVDRAFATDLTELRQDLPGPLNLTHARPPP